MKPSKQHSAKGIAHSKSKKRKGHSAWRIAREARFPCALHDPVVKLSIFVLLVISLFSPLKSFSAETIKLKYIQSIYFDDKGGSLKQPEGVACNEKSLLIVGDSGNGRLLRFTFEEKSLKSGTEIKVPQLSYPVRIQINSKGEIFALDEKQRRIIRLSAEGEFEGYVSPEGLPSPSTFVPRSIKIDANDNIYVLDIFSGCVWMLSPDGKYQKQIQFPKDYGFFSDLAVGPRGNILLIDSVKAAVFLAAKDSNNFSPLTKSLREHLNFPTSITTDNRGTIYIVDENGSGIVILGQDGSFMGRQLSMGWNEGLLYYPSQMCINEKGEVFIADRGNSRVQIFAVVK
jgi:DNA-binding beta-propeller fold protein YncE